MDDSARSTRKFLNSCRLSPRSTANFQVIISCIKKQRGFFFFKKKDLGADNGQTLLVPSFYLVNAKDREDHKCPPLLAWEYDEQKFLFGYV